MEKDTESCSISPVDLLELEQLWQELDLEDQIAISGEVAVKRIMRLKPWQRMLIILFALVAAFELAYLMSRSPVVVFSLGLAAGLAAGLLVKSR